MKRFYARLLFVVFLSPSGAYALVFVIGWQGWRITGNSIAPIAGSNLRYKIEGSYASYFLVDYNFGNTFYDHDFRYYTHGAQEGILHIEPYPDRENVLIQVTAFTENGRKSDTLTIRNQDWWRSYSTFWFLYYLGKNHVMQHTFRIS